MEPDLPKGAQVLINRNDTRIEHADIYAIKEPNGRVWLRWIRKNLGNTYTLYANDQTHNPEQTLSEDVFKELDLLGRYVWIGSWREK
ncbi:S24 family peptidase [Shewanella surugensis]|uniref:S24/S26 family peptidase n=1 Tax=Shewanella surugensis TaxID=212020 RepID=A0ABT0LHJ2_9GAMM|nr:S24/S26 family peptidase [Shewanella surugensis]